MHSIIRRFNKLVKVRVCYMRQVMYSVVRRCSKLAKICFCCLFLLLLCLTLANAGRLKVCGEYIRTGAVCAPREDVLLALPVESHGTEMILQVSVSGLRVTEKTARGRVFHHVRLKGYGYTSQAGKPLLPVKGFHIAVPEGSIAVVEVMGSESTVENGYTIYPVPRMSVTETNEGTLQTVEEFYQDAAAYASNRLYPERIAAVGSYGNLRNVRVVRITVSPIQYNPATGELRYHRRIWLKVKLIGGRFSEPKSSRAVTAEKGAPFEAVYDRVVLNYDEGQARTGSVGRPLRHRAYNLDYLNGFPYKLSVDEDGIYEIGYQDLLDAGISPAGIDPRTIKIFNGGNEIAIFVYGEEDGTFDSGDYVEFFGLRGRSLYSNANVYWLSWGGSDGLRIEEVDCSPGDSLPVPISYLQKLHFENDWWYYCCVFQGEGKDHWFWERLNDPVMQDFPVTIPDVYPGADDVAISVKLLGKTFGGHRTRIYVNAEIVADHSWGGAVEYEINTSCPHSYLENGFNYFFVEVPNSPEADQTYVNWFEIEYQRYYRAYEDVLRFIDSNPGPNQIEIEGFTGGQIELFRITDPEDVERMSGFDVAPSGTTYTLTFEEAIDQEEYLALTAERRMSPTFLGWYESANLRSPGNRADYIIITHEDFYESVQRLKSIREGDGLTVAVVDAADIYDEFSYGNYDPNAIKDFLTYAFFEWSGPAPSYVLLVGDASYDYRGNVAAGNINYVPTHLFVSQSEYVEVSSDDWFAYLVGDDRLPDMLVGRLSAQTASEVDVLIDKTIGYETNLPPLDWMKRILLVADNPDQGGNFEGISDVLADIITAAGFDTVKCYVSRCHPGCTQCIIGSIDNGVVICNYLGHGSIDTWTSEQIFLSSDVASLNNGNLLPLLLTFTCLNGFFHHATDDYCLAEEFHRADNKGAVACWAHSGLDWAYSSSILAENLYDAFLNDGNTILGSAVCQAKAGYLAGDPQYWDQAMMLILFGDPALEMGFSATPDLLPGDITFSPVLPVAGSHDTVRATVYNAGRGAASDVALIFTNGSPDSAGSTLIGEVTIPYLEAGTHITVFALWDTVPAVGTYPIFVEVDPENVIAESGEWNNLLWDTVRVRSPDDVLDTIPPVVELFIDEKRVGSEFADYDYTSSSPLIKAALSDQESGVDIDEIGLTLNGEPVYGFLIDSGGNGSKTATVRYQPEFLPDARYVLAVECADTCIVPNKASASVAFVVESHIRLRNVRNYPNPWSKDTRFYYYLSRQTEDVTIRIYSVTGALIKTIHRAPGNQNANVMHWDGTDEHGVAVASGVYFYTIIAKGIQGRDEAAGKMILIR